MLGWHISVYRQAQGGAEPAHGNSETAERLAVWQTGLDGIDWLQSLAEEGRAIDLGGGGYPWRFTARTADLRPTITAGPPRAMKVWVSGPHDVIDYSKWPGKTTFDKRALKKLDPDEWLLVEAWDED